MRANVYLHGELAGTLERRPDGDVIFQYAPDYLALSRPPLSMSLPLREAPFIARGLPGYFSGLVSEGWLKRMQSQQQHIDPDDQFALLVHNGRDLPGAVTIELSDLS
ncbi:type II toxin-antitoxin system HipA family toxin [Marinobacter halodurans]|uniref:Type II toxin-antitoxin system HipA family toxin n=1 Tax=Marinobacter halodurans TaxID=2528979 RepID=A0ABY1ZGP5_9GAMM|nr:HipA N-terminal domain-containing protein [Marinobacter halodurans]TBW51300.1 type II toxin-antitoxin system HipA family toxin [Marinobacter halodurans]